MAALFWPMHPVDYGHNIIDASDNEARLGLVIVDKLQFLFRPM